MLEEALLLGPTRTNVGVFTPATDIGDAKTDLAAICITAGFLHHVGPHRMHVLLARSLAKRGIGTLRFDLSGIGDSSVRSDDLPALEVPVQEITDAIKELESRGFKRFVLFGICSGALNATRAAIANPNIAGVVLVNSGGDDGSTDANAEVAAQMYLKRSMLNLKSWKNLFTGKVNYRALLVTLSNALVNKLTFRNKNASSFEAQLKTGIQPFLDKGTSILMILSDRHAQLYEVYRKAFENVQSDKFETLIYADTDHLFTSVALQHELIDRIGEWSSELGQQNA